MTTDQTLSLPDGPPIPEMRESALSAEDIHALAADLTTHAVIHSIICKGGARQHSPAKPLRLDDAVEQLLSKTVAAVQVRYQFDSHDWTDTLMNTPNGIKLVRCQHPTASQT